MIRPLQMLIGAVVLAALAMWLIPVPKPSPDFGQSAAGESKGASSAQASASVEKALRDTRWYELMPKDWDPYKQLREMQKGMRFMPDTDPDGPAMLKKMREIWDDAPINPAMDGAAVRILGYVVPLDESKRGLKEFLLVPYFGACIHSPPPPSNQIIHVVPREPVPGVRSMDTVWIGGTLKVVRSDSPMGISSYDMDAIKVEPYVPPKRD